MTILEGIVKRNSKKYFVILHSVNIKYKIVKLNILKMLVKPQKIVEQANSI